MNQEFEYWKNYFLSSVFKKRFDYLKTKYKNKKIIFYSNGIFFDALISIYNLKEHFEVIGFSDIKYEQEKNKTTPDYIAPSEIKNFDFDYIIITSPNTDKIKNFLTKNKIAKKNRILPLIKTNNGFELQEILNYLKVSKNIFNTFKYAFSCNREELKTKTNYLKVIKKIKDKQKIKVAFICEENSKWGYQFLYEKLSKNKFFEVLPIVLYPIVTKNRIEYTQKENAIFFKKLGIETIDGYDYTTKQNIDIGAFNPDIVFYQQPWYLQGNNHPTVVSEYALTIMIPYGFTTLSGKEWGSDSVKRVYSNLWKFFSESKYHNKFYEKYANLKSKDILFASGSAKLEHYKTTAKDVLWKGNNITAKIIWAPHHSIGNDGLRMSTFKENYKYFLNFAKSHPEFSFILKPHPALRNACISLGFLSEKEYDDYMYEWNNLPNAYIFSEGNYFDIFKTSDILITDCSSFLAEYFPTEKPIILLNRKDRAPFDKFGEKLKKGFYIIEDNNIDLILQEILNKKSDTLKNTRISLNKKLFNHKNISDKILNHIMESLL